MPVTLTFEGSPQMAQRLQILTTQVAGATREALHDEGNRIMGESVRLVPIDTGNLRSTAHVERPVETGTVVEVELRYGGFGLAPYAVIVELDVTMNHPHGGQSHYLTQPFNAATGGMGTRLAQAIGTGLRGA